MFYYRISSKIYENISTIFFCFLFFNYNTGKLKAQITIDTLQTKNYQELYSFYIQKLKTKDTLQASIIAKTYLNKAKKTNNKSKIIKGYENYTYIVNQIEVINYLDSIINITKHKPDKIYPAFAYFRKAQFYLYSKRNITEAINNIKYAREYSNYEKNKDLLYSIEYMIGIIKSEHLNEKEEAIKIFKKCANYYNKRIKKVHIFHFLYTTNIIAETYIELKKYDSATSYNKLGYQKALKNKKTSNLKSLFIIREGINQFHKKNYQATIDSITKGIPEIIRNKNIPNVIESYFYLALANFKIGKETIGIKYFKKTDSILDIVNSIPKYKHTKTYEYLKNYYQKRNDNYNHNKYLTKLNTVLDHYINDKIHISTKVKQDYDIPVLLEEQKSVIKKLNETNNSYTQSILLLFLLLFTSGSLVYYLLKRKKIYQQRFNDLIEAKNNIQKNSTQNNNDKSTKNKLNIPEKHINSILEKLNEFEEKKEYLSQGLNSKSLAVKIGTNVKYLSKIINYYKNKTFINYLNELRINYVINDLKNNNNLKKYTIKAIAEEIGYNNAETFSKAFYKQTGIKPSYFINQLTKQKSLEKTHN